MYQRENCQILPACKDVTIKMLFDAFCAHKLSGLVRKVSVLCHVQKIWGNDKEHFSEEISSLRCVGVWYMYSLVDD